VRAHLTGAASALMSGVLWWKGRVGVWFKFTLGKVLLFVLTSTRISCFCCYTVILIRTKDLKVGPLIKFGSLWHRCLSLSLNKGWVSFQDRCPSLKYIFFFVDTFCVQRSRFPEFFPRVGVFKMALLCSQSTLFVGKWARSRGKESSSFSFFSICHSLREHKA
jgi:hypothetical protein